MSTSPEEVKRRAKQLLTAMQEIREETLQLPILRKRLIGFTSQLRQRGTIPEQAARQLSPEQMEALQQQAEQNPPVSTSGQLQLFQRPRLFQGQTPIRGAVANLINALTVKSTGVTQKQEEDEQAYEERQKDLEASEMAQARLKRKGIYKEHGIEI